MKVYDVSRLPSSITLGWDGENNWRPIAFDCSALLNGRSDAVATLWLLPKGENQAFPVALERDGNTVVWTPLNEEMTAERGQLQIVVQDGTDVGKSKVIDYTVHDSLVSGADHPAGTPSWATQVVEDVTEAAGHYPRIVNGNWYVWDATEGDWVDTGVSAGGGDIDPEDIAEAVEDYFEENPIDYPVDSVNGKTGDVVLDASDVGALPDDTVIPAAVTEQDVAGWGFTKNTGTYSKPSGGIPASDLAAGVIPDISGKVDKLTGYGLVSKSNVTDGYELAIDENGTVTIFQVVGITAYHTTMQQAMTVLAGKADASSVYTKTEIDNKGYQTAAQVQTYVAQQIAAIPDELPSGGSAGDFLRKTASGVAWETVPSAESASFGGGS